MPSEAKNSKKTATETKKKAGKTVYSWQPLSKTGTKKLAYSAGVRRIKRDALTYMDSYAREELELLLSNCVIACNNKDRKTITHKMVRDAIAHSRIAAC